ncbi:MAG: AIR synthase-related protein, partial [Actinobacteria bacterium]|nr:AIR synthase-related protein [Actinomycetota bacterium]
GSENGKGSSENNGMGGSEFMELFFNKVAGICPDIDLNYEKSLHGLIIDLIKNGLIKSAHDVSTGGIAVTIAESCIFGKTGAKINIDLNEKSLLENLYNEKQSRIVVSADSKKFAVIRENCEKSNIACKVIGSVGGESLIVNNELEINVNEITKLYDSTIEKIMSK